MRRIWVISIAILLVSSRAWATPTPTATPTQTPTPVATASATPTGLPTAKPIILTCIPGDEHADSCGTSSGNRPCSLPGLATFNPQRILPTNGNRRELLVYNRGPATLFLLVGQAVNTTNYLAGVPVMPGQLFDRQIQPEPNTAKHTWTGPITVVTAQSNACFTYAEQSN